MKTKLLQHANKVLGFAIFGLVGGLTGCLVKYGCPPDDPEQEVLYGPASVSEQVVNTSANNPVAEE